MAQTVEVYGEPEESRTPRPRDSLIRVKACRFERNPFGGLGCRSFIHHGSEVELERELYVALTLRAAILPYGIGYLTVDGPGTGQSPVTVSESAERCLSRVLDYLQSRPEVDASRIAIHGVSWGAYWATKMAIVERSRLKGASAQSLPVDAFFQKDFLMNSLLGNS